MVGRCPFGALGLLTGSILSILVLGRLFLSDSNPSSGVIASSHFPNFPLETEQRHKHHCPQSVKHRQDVWDENGKGLDVLAELVQPTNSWQTRRGSPFWGYLTEKPSWEGSHIPFPFTIFESMIFRTSQDGICYISFLGGIQNQLIQQNIPLRPSCLSSPHKFCLTSAPCLFTN